MSNTLPDRPAHEPALPVAVPGVIFQRVSEGGVLLSIADEVYYGLNAVGADVWELLPESSSMTDLCARLIVRYPDAPEADVAVDVEDLLAELEAAGLVAGLRRAAAA